MLYGFTDTIQILECLSNQVCLYNLPCSPLVTIGEEDAHLLGSLVKNFQQQSFKGWQLKVIHATLEGKDILVVQPTGAGRSFCFQFPTTVTKKITIVITPMISLMIDQVKNLQLKGLRATYLGSAQRDTSMETRVLERRFHIIYCTPESFVNATGSMKPPFRSLLAQRMMGLIAIDEAHLVRTWRSFRYGGDHTYTFIHIIHCIPEITTAFFYLLYRPAYQHLYNVIRSIPAVTAMGSHRHCYPTDAGYAQVDA